MISWFQLAKLEFRTHCRLSAPRLCLKPIGRPSRSASSSRHAGSTEPRLVGQEKGATAFLHKQLKTAVVLFFLSSHNPDLQRQGRILPTPSPSAEWRLGVHARWEDAGSFPSLISRSQLHNVGAKTHSQDHKPLCTRSRPERNPLCVLESIKEGHRGSDVKTVCC